ncbi:ARF13 [Arabidopsis thaliana]|uniref:Auxin-responsive protein n=1 Tax=Arabidopsis thaliana TaxID=3702 RepID=A0A178W3M7_ARATH|nr:ARF13 [Arabidopsis thaliana]
MYEKLWNICAGPLCVLSKPGEKVYYFPQGHIELIENSTRDELDHIRPIFDLPSKLRCRVVAIDRKVDKNTDEVYAQISLMPDTTDMSQPISTQNLVAKDLHGQEWSFKHVFREERMGSYELVLGEQSINKATYLHQYDGTIIGVNDMSPHWKDSEWRSLKVQWDELSPFLRPNQVSPWDIEHLIPSLDISQSSLKKKKHWRQLNEIGATSSNLWTCQEIGQRSMNSPISVPEFSYPNAVEDSKFPSGLLLNHSLLAIPNENYNSDQMIQPRKEDITTEATTSCLLFGVDLTKVSKSKDSICPIESCKKSEISKLSQDKKFDQTQPLRSPKEVQSTEFNFTRSRIKVHMQGVAISRVVDLTAMHGYNQLIQKLEELFDLKDELRTRNQWEIVFTDNEGAEMLVGDDPWPEFCNMAKRIFIYSKEEIKKMKLKNKFFQPESKALTSSDVPPNVTDN